MQDMTMEDACWVLDERKCVLWTRTVSKCDWGYVFLSFFSMSGKQEDWNKMEGRDTWRGYAGINVWVFCFLSLQARGT